MLQAAPAPALAGGLQHFPDERGLQVYAELARFEQFVQQHTNKRNPYRTRLYVDLPTTDKFTASAMLLGVAALLAVVKGYGTVNFSPECPKGAPRTSPEDHGYALPCRDSQDVRHLDM